MPAWYLDEPPLCSGDDFYLSAFWDLNTCRVNGFGLGPIPWDKVNTYALTARLDEDLIRPFIRIIRAMDTAYIDWMDKQETNNSNLGNKTKER